jgi:hypothetical protein
MMAETAGVEKTPSCPITSFPTPFPAEILMIICSASLFQKRPSPSISESIILRTSNDERGSFELVGREGVEDGLHKVVEIVALSISGEMSENRT